MDNKFWTGILLAISTIGVIFGIYNLTLIFGVIVPAVSIIIFAMVVFYLSRKNVDKNIS